jgi:uncharacterized protein YggU (UPF0235/DUF167 family)
VLRVPKRAISLVVGASGKNKVVEVEGLDLAEVSARLEQNRGSAG